MLYRSILFIEKYMVTLIARNGDKRYIKRNEKGQIKESDDVGKSLSQDVKKHAKTEVKAGYGD